MFPTTHISLCCIQCVMIVLHLLSWPNDPHLLLSSFKPYLSDPLTLLSLIHPSHNDVLPLFSLSHNVIVVLLIFREAESSLSHSHQLHVTYLRYYKCVDSVAGCSSALLFQEILYPSQVSVPVKDKLEFSGKSLANNPLSSHSDSSPPSITVQVYPIQNTLAHQKKPQFQGTHHDLSRS